MFKNKKRDSFDDKSEPEKEKQIKKEPSLNNEVLQVYLDAYDNQVENIYIHQVKSNPEAFPLYKNKNLTLSFILLNENFFDRPLVILISDNKSAKYLYDYRNQNNEMLSREYIKYSKTSEWYVKEVLRPFNLDDYIYILDVINTLDHNDKTISDYTYGVIQREAVFCAEAHYRIFDQKMNESIESKKHDQVLPFSHLNLNDLTRTVDSETFEYQINQGLEAFKRELYLPAAATFAVAIETLLVEVCLVNDIKHRDSDATMYDKLLEKLKHNKAISYRDKRRIEVAYSLRNVIHHTQAGAIAKEDCDFMLTTIKSIVDSYRDQFLRVRHVDEDIDGIDNKIKDITTN